MSDLGIIYYADGLINLYRNNIDLTKPVWKEQNSFQILVRRLSNIKASKSVLILPEQISSFYLSVAQTLNIDLLPFDTSKILEKPYALNQQHWCLENSSGNDSWYGESFAKAFEKYGWKTAILIPLTNLLIDAKDVEESLELYFNEGFEVCLPEERISGAEWALFDRDLIIGLYRSHPEIMTSRGALYWAIKKPLYPFKVGSYHCPRIRPSINANLKLNSLRALNCYSAVAPDNFDSPDFSYEKFINSSGWEKAYLDYAPLQINVEPSSFCNAKCLDCPNTLLKRNKSFLNLELFKKAISDIQDKEQRIVFSGIGEPLLNNKINEIIKSANDFCTTLHTSLQIMPDENFPYKSLDHIRISIDSDAKNSFERIRKGCSWQNIEDFIEKSSNLKETYETIFPEIGLDFVRRNISEADIIPFLKKWRKKCKPVFKDDFFRWPYSNKPDEISWYQISKQSDYCGTSKDTSTVSYEPFKRRLCRNAFDLTILSDGNVTACPFDTEGNLFYLGNIKDNTLLEIWNFDKSKEWREKHLKKNFYKNSYCFNCHDWYNYF